jgi:hypothetical protein
MTVTVWHELKELSAELFRCDLCGEQATTIHLVPWCGSQCEQALFACAIHDPGGYWFDLDRWLGDEHDDLKRHLDEKVDWRRANAERPGGLALLLEREHALMHPVARAEGATGTFDLTDEVARIVVLAHRLVRKATADRVAPVEDRDCEWRLTGAGYPAELYALAAALDELSRDCRLGLSLLIERDPAERDGQVTAE